jgi:hypothetical protein
MLMSCAGDTLITVTPAEIRAVRLLASSARWEAVACQASLSYSTSMRSLGQYKSPK